MRISRQLAFLCIIAPALAWSQYGQLDTSFNGVGYASFGQMTAPDTPSSLSLHANGRITVSSHTGISLGLNRLMPDGSLDLSFGDQGYVYHATAAYNNGSAMLELPDDKLMLIGMGASDENTVRLIRILADGQRDSSFGANGEVTVLYTPYGRIDVAAAVLLNDGRILVAGTSTSDKQRMFLGRFLEDGAPDMSFGLGGYNTFDVLFQNRVKAMALRPNGKVLLAGNGVGTGSQELVLLQVSANGTVDASFGTQGAVTMDLGYANNDIWGITLADDGGVIACGAVYEQVDDAQSLLMRFDSSGQLDPGFADEGILLADLGPGYERFNQVLFDSGNTFLVVGSVSGASSASLSLARYYLDGSPESTFGTGGLVSSTQLSGLRLMIQPDNMILVAGQQGSFETSAAVARFTPGMITSIHESGELKRLVAFPNPATQSVQFELPMASSTWEARIIDAQGKELLRTELGVSTAPQLSVQDLAPGSYHVLLSAGEVRYRSAFVKLP